MPLWLQWSLIAVGLVASALLVFFIVRQSSALKQHRIARTRSTEFQARRREDMIESIRIIAMAVEQDQIEYSEACLRIKGLLDHVDPTLLEKQPYSVFLDIHNKLDHMPTHRARQRTDARFLEKMDKERQDLEVEHGDAIRRAATAIRHHAFDSK